jgi:hypothetical protein
MKEADLLPLSEPQDDADDQLPDDGWRKCGGCGEQFWSEVHRCRPTITPLFCAECDRRNGAETRARDEERRARAAAKRAADADTRGLADALLKPARKSGKTKLYKSAKRAHSKA